jgi:pyruvate dehydrogenase E2 component (dihydrolipoyllysine-residue acetyltransferase)
MRRIVLVLAILLASAAAIAAQVVVLKGGTRIELAKPYGLRGSQAILVRKDGTVLSVPASEIDQKATEQANVRKAPVRSEAPSAPETLAEAARSTAGARGKVQITDADVAHPMETSEEAPPASSSGGARVRVTDWKQAISGGNIVITGSVQNVGTDPANGVSLSVEALDGQGKVVATGFGTVAAGTLAPGATASFSATLSANHPISTFTFHPRWEVPARPEAEAGAGAAADQQKEKKAEAAPKPAAPAPTPAPQKAASTPPSPAPAGGYAAPIASAPVNAPAQPNGTYVPGVDPQSQPHPVKPDDNKQ